MKPRTSKYGACRLTGTNGKFVKSHLIPRAFTKPEEAGAPMLQAGMSGPVTVRYDSWYDQQLCTRVGEDILARIDDAAITELRRLKLVWSGWGTTHTLGADHTQLGDTAWGVRSLNGANLSILRTYFLSLLWRAAATDRFEFAEVSVPDADLERIRQLVLSGAPGPIDFYPVSLTQLSTRGLVHNHTPIIRTKSAPATDDLPEWSIEIVRFYHDGLIAHVHKHSADEGRTAALGPLIVGGAERLIVSTVTYDASFQAETINKIIERASPPSA